MPFPETTRRHLAYGADEGGHLWGPLMLENLQRIDGFAAGQWGWDRDATEGLTYGYFGGSVIAGAVHTLEADGTVVLADNDTNYVERSTGGTVSANVVGWTAGAIPIAEIVTAGGQVTAHEDWRPQYGSSSSGPPAAHDLVGASHSVAGLTPGHFLKATGATTVAFGAHGLSYGDVGAAAAVHTHPWSDIVSGVPTTWTPIAHDLLSAYHGDTTPGSVVRGDVVTGQVASPNTKWMRLAKGTPGHFFKAGADDVGWAAHGLTYSDVGAEAYSAKLAGIAALADAAGWLHSDGSLGYAWSTPPTAAHEVLSASHSDTTVGTVVRGDVITGQGATPKWVRLAFPGTPTGKVLVATATDVAWSAAALGTAAWAATGDFAAASHNHAWSALTSGVPTTIGGYGITDFNSLGDARWSLTGHNHSGTYQPVHANLTSLAALSYVSASFVKMTSAGTFALDTGTYDPAGTGHTEAAAHVSSHEGTYNHANYNTAYGWGNHAGLYLAVAGTAADSSKLNGQSASYYQTAHANLTSLAALSYVSASFVKMTAAGTFALDTATYSASGHTHAGTYEPVLGNPGASGYVLSSTDAGVRSWISPANWNTAYGWGNHASAGYGPAAGSSSIVTVGTITSGIWNAGAVTSSGTIQGGLGIFAAHGTPSGFGYVGLEVRDSTASSYYPAIAFEDSAGNLLLGIRNNGSNTAPGFQLYSYTGGGGVVLAALACAGLTATTGTFSGLTQVVQGRILSSDLGKWNQKALWLNGAGYTNDIVTINFGYQSPSYVPATFAFLVTAESGYTYGDFIWALRTVVTDTQPTEKMRLTSAGALTLAAGLTATTGTFSGVLISNQDSGVNPRFIVGNTVAADRAGAIDLITTSTYKNWRISQNWYNGGCLDLTPSTAAGGTTWTTSVFTLTPAGALTLAAGLTATTGTFTGAPYGVRVYDSTAQAAGVGGAIIFEGKYTAAGDSTTAGAVSARKTTATADNFGFGLSFKTRVHGSGGIAEVAWLSEAGALTLAAGLTATTGTFSGEVKAPGFYSSSVMQVQKNGSDTPGAGPFWYTTDGTGNIAWLHQLNASNGMNWWYYGAGWELKATLASTGALTLAAGLTATTGVTVYPATTVAGSYHFTTPTGGWGAKSSHLTFTPKDSFYGTHDFDIRLWNGTAGTLGYGTEATVLSINGAGGALTLAAGITATTYSVGANQVVGARGAAVADATDAASVILRLNDLLARARTHGLIST